jgi:hypothetical protein
VVADILYGEHRKLKEGLENRGIPYVLAIKPSYAWYRPIGEPGTVEEIARIAPYHGPDDPGEWVKLSRTFRDGHTLRSGGRFLRPSADRSEWRNEGDWWWRQPILPSCRTSPPGTW